MMQKEIDRYRDPNYVTELLKTPEGRKKLTIDTAQYWARFPKRLVDEWHRWNLDLLDEIINRGSRKWPWMSNHSYFKLTELEKWRQRMIMEMAGELPVVFSMAHWSCSQQILEGYKLHARWRTNRRRA